MFFIFYLQINVFNIYAFNYDAVDVNLYSRLKQPININVLY